MFVCLFVCLFVFITKINVFTSSKWFCFVKFLINNGFQRLRLLFNSMSPDFPFSFFVQSPYSTLSYPNKTTSGLTQSECVESCLYAVDFNCLSVEYHQESTACLLSVASATSLATSLTTDKHYNYYEKLVGKSIKLL